TPHPALSPSGGEGDLHPSPLEGRGQGEGCGSSTESRSRPMPYRVIGKSEPRADAWEKVRGRPIYAGDLAIAGMLHGRIVRSPYASARITRIDTSAARALRGVIAVLTHADVPQNSLRMELPGRMAEATAGAVLATQPVLAEDRVRFQGEPVVAIA